MLAFVLLAQVAAASPYPSPTPEAALGTTTASVSAKPRTLADLARERKLGKKGVTGGTLSVTGASGMPVVLPETDAPTGKRVIHERNARLRNAEADVLAARRAVDEQAVRKGMTAEDTAAARRKLDDARRELNKAREAAAR